MKKSLLLLAPALLFAQSFMLSNIPLPKTYIQNIDPYRCDALCMQDFLDNGQVFSFLAHAESKLKDPKQNEDRVMFISIFNLGSMNSEKKLKIALLLPYKKIGKYASSTTNATLAYLMTKSHPFQLKSYKIKSESAEDLATALKQIKSDGFRYVIAPLTHKGAKNLIDIHTTLNIYLPTINKHDINSSSPYLTFGAIDYHTQSNLLLKEAHEPLVIFSDKSETGKTLASYQKQEFIHPSPLPDSERSGSFIQDTFSIFSQMVSKKREPVAEKKKKVISYSISRRTTNLERYLKENKKIANATIMINTPIIKTGMILSQLTLYDVNETNTLSTQINYDPLLLSMTQYNDRKDMIVANSITEHNNILIETNTLLGNDIEYDWINYTTTIGIDYFYSLITNDERIYNTKIENHQILYNIELFRAGRSKFLKYIRPTLVED